MHVIEPSGQHGQGTLSQRQRQCMILVGEGLTSKQIARTLGIAPSTVDNHIRAVIIQLGAANRTEAARIVLQEGRNNGSALHASERLSVEDGSDTGSSIRLGQIPPFGGKLNDANNLQRIVYVGQIALLGTMLFAALTATIAGVVQLFSN